MAIGPGFIEGLQAILGTGQAASPLGILGQLGDKKGGAERPASYEPDLSKVPQATGSFHSPLTPEARANLLAVMMKRSRSGGQMPPTGDMGA